MPPRIVAPRLPDSLFYGGMTLGSQPAAENPGGRDPKPGHYCLGMHREQRIREAMASDPYAASQGFALVEVTDDSLTVQMTVREDQVNFLGGTHGGVLHSLADCAFSLASNAHPEDAVAIDTHLAITAPSGVGDVLTAVAREETLGRSLATYRVDVTRPDGRTAALFTGTVFRIAKES